MTRPKVTVLITDLDNTLFDWVDIWYRSFSAMLDSIVEISGIAKEVLIQEIQSVHQKHGTSEYAFLIEELPSLIELHGADANLPEIYDDAIHAFRRGRKAAMQLFPKVLRTLQTIKERRSLIVGYTESLAFYTNMRVRALELDGVIDFLFSPRDHDFPKNLTPQQVRMYPPAHYKLKATQHLHTPDGEHKPNPQLLLDIVEAVGARRSECVYVGDSLHKDIEMAQQAGIQDVFAAYGVAHNRQSYDLLRAVTHWTEEQVELEKRLREVDVKPTRRLENGLHEILEQFQFLEFNHESKHS